VLAAPASVSTSVAPNLAPPAPASSATSTAAASLNDTAAQMMKDSAAALFGDTLLAQSSQFGQQQLYSLLGLGQPLQSHGAPAEPVAQSVNHPHHQTLQSSQQDSLLQPFGMQHVRQPPVQIVDEWLYTDPQNNVQGPFPSKNMSRWYEAGYFKMELPIKLRHWNQFYPLGMIFPSRENAFREFPSEPGQEGGMLDVQRQQQQAFLMQQEQQRQAMILEQQRQQQVMDQQRQAEQQRQQQLMEQQRMAEQQRQAQMLEHQRQSHMLEQQRQAQMLDQQRQLMEQQRQAQAMEQQRQAAMEQQRQAQALEQQRLQAQAQAQAQQLLEQQRQQAHGMERQRQEMAAQQQRNQMHQQQQPPQPQSVPWTSAESKSGQTSLSAILREEESQQKSSQAPQINNPAMSQQLKSFLGVQAQGIQGTANRPVSIAYAPPPAAAPWVGPAAASGNSGSLTPGKSLKDIQTEEQTVADKQAQAALEQHKQRQKLLAEQEAAAARMQSQQQSALTAANWTNKSVSAANSKSSLRDIMEQEATVEVAPSTGDGQQRMMPGTWAAKIASPSAWSLSASSPAPAPATAQPTPAAPSAVQPVAPAPPILSVPRGPPSAGPTSAGSSSVNTTVGKSSPLPMKGDKGDDFGGKGMSASMHDWCVSSMRRLNGTDDITLLQFCMGVDSAVEIREYFSAYLGSTPQVRRLPDYCLWLITLSDTVLTGVFVCH
jgi:hypothetical protein